MTTTHDPGAVIRDGWDIRPLPAHRAVGRDPGMGRIVARTPLWFTAVMAGLVRLVRPTRRG